MASAQESVGDRFRRAACTDGMPVSRAVQRANAAVVRSFVEQGLGRGDLTAFDRYVAPEIWVSTGLKPEAPITSREEYKRVVASTLGVALSSTNATLDIQEVLVTQDGRVIVRFVAHADHVGALNGVPATNRRLTLAETHLMCVRGGKIVENYVGALNPLQWEMIYSDKIKRQVLP
ncbi:ester cyclase [Sphingomonas sp. MMS24-J45]|uniref:ester cyclase n=1 Tax=Sphingomonas sp. MMS24-J45 TaxID=3238806 RepID=UPI00384BE8EA